MRSERREVPSQIRLRHIEKTVVIKWPAATQMLIENLDPAARLFQHFYRCLRRFWHEVVIERIGPQKDSWPGSWTLFATAEP